MNEKQLSVVKSACRHFAIAFVIAWQSGAHDWKSLAFAVAAAIVGPALRGIDKNDPAFGRVADIATDYLDKLSKVSKPKVAKKPTK